MTGFKLVEHFTNNIEIIEKNELLALAIALSVVVNMEQVTYSIPSYNLFS
jgi:hypothetical protein